MTSATPADRYDRLWDAGRPDLDAFLAAAGGLTPDELAAVLRADQRRRWRAGERAPAEFYVRRLPGDPPDPEAALDLVYNEYLIREGQGERPDPGEFARRFPDHAAALREQIALHSAVGAGDGSSVVDRPPDTGADPPRPPAGEKLPREFGRYQLLEVLGRGGMGAVYLAHDPVLDRRVALKIPRFDAAAGPDAVERFRREARAAAAVRHPNICPVYDVGRVDGVDYLTMPHIPGESLAARLARAGPLPQPEAAGLVLRVAEAMAAAHRAGVVHRDLKPSNVLLDERGEPVVTDFGLARRVGGTDPRVTDTGAILGTAAYLPPEQIGCRPDAVGPRSDVYSLGVILYELLTGQPPFAGSAGEVLMRVLGEQPEPPSLSRPGLDPRLERVCLTAMAKDAARRFATMEEFAEALRPFAAGNVEPPRRSVRPGPLLVGAALLAVLAVAGGAWLALKPSTAPTQATSAPTAAAAAEAPDPFAAGSEWVGTFHFLNDDVQRPVALSVGKRDGEKFEGVYTAEVAFRWEVSGTARDGVVEWKLTKALTNEAKGTGATGKATVRGSYANGSLTAKYKDQDSEADMTLRRSGADRK
jgi:hypothetical protein